MLERSDRAALVREHFDAVGFTGAVLLEQHVATPFETSHLLGQRGPVDGIGDGVAFDAATVSDDPGEARLDHQGPAECGGRPQ